MRTVVLIGPPAAGKSTVGRLLAAARGTDFVDVDQVGDAYYRASGQPLEWFVDKIAHEGFAAAHRWWQPARVAAAGPSTRRGTTGPARVTTTSLTG